MCNLSAADCKKGLITKIRKLFIYNIWCYVCLILVEIIINNDWFSFNHFLLALSILTILVSVPALLIFLIPLTTYIDIKFEPMYRIFKIEARIDFYLRVLVIVLTLISSREIINTQNILYLQIFIISFLCINLFIEYLILRKVNKTSESQIKEIKSKYKVKISEVEIPKYKLAWEKGKKATTFLFCSIFIGTMLAKYTIIITLLFAALSIVSIYLLEHVYSLLYKQRSSYKLLSRYAVFICGYIIVILINQKILFPSLYQFSGSELISIIGFSSIPIFIPIREIYIALKLSDNI